MKQLICLLEQQFPAWKSLIQLYYFERVMKNLAKSKYR